MLNKKRVLSAAVAGVAGLVVASSAAASGAYFGGQLGYGLSHQSGFTNSDVNQLLAGSTSSSYTRSNSPNGIAGRIFGGYDVIENIAAELGFTKFSNATAKFSGTATYPAPVGSVSFSDKETIKLYAVDLVAKGTMPLSNGFSAIGKLGVAYLHGTGNATASVAGNPNATATQVDRKFLPTFGLGLGYQINSNVSTDLSWQRIQKVGSTKFLQSTDFFGLGLGYHFG